MCWLQSPEHPATPPKAAPAKPQAPPVKPQPPPVKLQGPPAKPRLPLAKAQGPPAKPQAAPVKPPRSILGSLTNLAAPSRRQATSTYARGKLHTSTGTQNPSTGPPSSARQYKRSQLGTSAPLPSQINAGTSITRHPASPLIGNRVNIKHTQDYYAQNGRPDMVEKLEQLPHLCGWRSIRGRPFMSLHAAAKSALLNKCLVPCCMGHAQVCILGWHATMGRLYLWDACYYCHSCCLSHQSGVLCFNISMLC